MRLLERAADLDAAAAVVDVDEREVLPREDVSRVSHAQLRERDERIAVGVATSEVVQVDTILSRPDGHLVLERPLGQAAAVVRLEDVHRLHVGLGVLLSDHLDRRGELHVAAHVVAVRMRVDQDLHRLVGQPFQLLEERLAPAGILRVDDHDAVCDDEDGSVAAAALQHEQVVLDLLDLDDLRSLLLLQAGRQERHQACREQRPEH